MVGRRKSARHWKCRANREAGKVPAGLKRDGLAGGVEVSKESFDLVAGEDGGQAFWSSGGGDAVEGRQRDVQHIPVEEEDGAAGDVLGGGGHGVVDGQVGQVLADVFGGEGAGVSPAMELKELSDTIKVDFFRGKTEVFESDDVADVLEELCEAFRRHCIPFRGVVELSRLAGSLRAGGRCAQLRRKPAHAAIIPP